MGANLNRRQHCLRWGGLGAIAAAIACAAAMSAPATASAACANSNARPQTISTRQASTAVVCLLNEVRVSHGIGRVASSKDLAGAAQAHTRYMVAQRCFDHVCPGEPDIFKRLRTTGYFSGAHIWTYGKNIAWGESSGGTPRALVKAWMASPGHRANILNSSFDHIGIGTVWGNPSRNSNFPAVTVTTDFGSAER